MVRKHCYNFRFLTNTLKIVKHLRWSFFYKVVTGFRGELRVLCKNSQKPKAVFYLCKNLFLECLKKF